MYDEYGPPDVLRLAEVDKPAPTSDQVLVRIHAVSINGSDMEGLAGRPLYARIGGLRRPGNRILGSDIAGTVEAAGRNVTEFQPGDAVFGEIPGYHGGLAEYVCTHGKTLAHKPPELTFEQAAAVPQGGVIALNGIRKKGRAAAGQQVLINGAGGSGGSFAVQLAKLHGAAVTGVDNAHKQEFMHALGADNAIDYTRQDFTRTGEQYDLILDLIAHRSPAAILRALRPGGTYLVVGGSVGVLLQVLLFGPLLKRLTGKNIRMLAVPQSREDLLAVTQLCTSGHLRPVIDRVYGFEDVPEAFRYIRGGRALGKVVILVVENGGIP